MKEVKDEVGPQEEGWRRENKTEKTLWVTYTTYPPAGRNFHSKNVDGLPAL
jgi:hypothetical protein